jgi:hypothetical protein
MRFEDDIKGFISGQQVTGDIARFYFFCLAFDQMMKEGVIGDIAELGVYKGNTASLLAVMARRMGTTAWILDTFEGFRPDDLTGIDSHHGMEFEDTSLEEVRGLVGEQNVRYVKGYFPESAAQMPSDLSFSLVHLDCDLYVSLKSALPYFYRRLLPGGYLIIHDYASLSWDGAEMAVDEFFADKQEPIIPLTDACGSAVIRKGYDGGRNNWMMRQRFSRFSEQWASAARGGLATLLGSGWSGTEAWGVWGLGHSHILNLYMKHAPTGDLAVDFDVAAALVGRRKTQEVDVLVGGEIQTTWFFSPGQNRSQRNVIVSRAAFEEGDWGYPVLRLELRPRDVEPTKELDPTSSDPRSLGVALFALRHRTPNPP